MIEEFCVVWFEQSQKWIVLFPNGEIIDNNFPAIGYATIAALKKLDAAEADFDVFEDTGTFYRFVPVGD